LTLIVGLLKNARGPKTLIFLAVVVEDWARDREWEGVKWAMKEGGLEWHEGIWRELGMDEEMKQWAEENWKFEVYQQSPRKFKIFWKF
jgi:hypothetical protein